MWIPVAGHGIGWGSGVTPLAFPVQLLAGPLQIRCIRRTRAARASTRPLAWSLTIDGTDPIAGTSAALDIQPGRRVSGPRRPGEVSTREQGHRYFHDAVDGKLVQIGSFSHGVFVRPLIDAERLSFVSVRIGLHPTDTHGGIVGVDLLLRRGIKTLEGARRESPLNQLAMHFALRARCQSARREDRYAGQGQNYRNKLLHVYCSL